MPGLAWDQQGAGIPPKIGPFEKIPKNLRLRFLECSSQGVDLFQGKKKPPKSGFFLAVLQIILQFGRVAAIGSMRVNKCCEHLHLQKCRITVDLHLANGFGQSLRVFEHIPVPPAWNPPRGPAPDPLPEGGSSDLKRRLAAIAPILSRAFMLGYTKRWMPLY